MMIAIAKSNKMKAAYCNSDITQRCVTLFSSHVMFYCLYCFYVFVRSVFLCITVLYCIDVRLSRLNREITYLLTY